MEKEPTWHIQAVEQLGQFFDREPDAKAFVLSGSLAVADVQEDAWSDVDVKIILADYAWDHYYTSTAWLSPFGRLIGAEWHENPLAKTLRVCLEGFKRFDLTFIAESAVQNGTVWEHDLFHSSDVVLWSKLPGLETRIASLPSPVEYQDMPQEGVEGMVDAFWFKAAVAITKVVRNDLLIGLHLALDLARDSLVLQMIRRDREKQTTIHRTGDWGNELVARFAWNAQAGSGEGILNLVQLSCELFDELASEILPDYNLRSPLLLPTIESAKQICQYSTGKL